MTVRAESGKVTDPARLI